MEQSNQSKKVLLSVIGVAILVVAVVGVSFAFFNYTRTGAQNTVSTGKIYFNHTQTGTIALTNVFPIDSTELTAQVADDTEGAHKDYAEVVIAIQGATTYAGGLDYRVSAQGVDFTIGDSNVVVPVNVEVTAANLGTGTTGNVDRCATTSYTSATPLKTGDILAEGHITNTATDATWNQTRLNGTLTIRVYIDKNKIAITDTSTAADSETGYTNGTTGDAAGTWVDGRLRLTTAQWNALNSDTLKFSVRVESKESTGTYALSLS